ncbi:hypothetical protein AWM70_15480 [Paenibacillus yonginensis]|uniref:Uncharacterized protein n=1 Tax=Paenibacillus yonginensis TaxID=1462996 RepID=A0A1B1N303_9BACL|nr:DUF6483 family protein [Paenibacillus yonginensis]ANS75813.1 hypothetical protein AWM70_15480 [Paenibacillus yonginensis]
MLRRDYLVRMIEDMTEAVGAIFGLKQQKKHTEALWEVDDLFKRHFRLNSQLLNSLSVKDIIDMFRLGDKVEADKLQSMARLMKEEGLIYLELNNSDEGLKRLMKALHLFIYSVFHGADKELWSVDKEVSGVLEAIKGYRLPVETEKLLFRYEEQEQRFDKAEDCLFRLRKDGEIGREEAAAFYERLLKLDDETLEQGGLPREEVLEGLELVTGDKETSNG